VLYVPASNIKALDKARSLAADVLIFDLEDAVLPEAKVGARQEIMRRLASGEYANRELVLRVNALDTEWGRADLEAAAHLPKLDAVLLPKVETAEAIRAADQTLAGAPPELAIWAMIETPRAVLGVDSIAAYGGRLSALVMGTSDLEKALLARTRPDRLPLLFSLSAVVLAARAHGLVALDGVELAIDDDARFEASTAQGRDLGFDGRTLIHPRTIDPANRIYSPSEAEIARAERIVSAYEAARAANQGVAVVDGRLIEALHVEEARRLIALSKAIAAISRI
jgi:citrate lyase subunit beta/citryl-CoA lyase